MELSLDAIDPSRAQIGFAGDTFNTAVYLKRAAPEIDVHFVTRVGVDNFSKAMLGLIEDEGISTSHVGQSNDRVPGLYAISTDASGERSFSYWRDRSAARELFFAGPPELDALSGFGVIYFSAITLAILQDEMRQSFLDWLQGYRSGGGRVVFDSNYRPKLWADRATAQAAITQAWRLTDIGLPSVDDEMAIFGDSNENAVLARLRDFGVHQGAMKCGTKGPISLSGDRGNLAFPNATRVVDTTAAGDSFNGGYLAAHLRGLSEAEALRAGHDCAVDVIGVKGAIIPRQS